MLSELELHTYFDRHQLSHDAQDYILRTRNGGPSRDVGKRANDNVTCSFPSEKMDRIIDVESQTVELLYARVCEFDDDVLEYHAQPAAIDTHHFDKNGRKKRRAYTSDFLVLHRSGPRIVQTKSQGKLEELAQKQPCNWSKNGSQYIYQPAVEGFAKLGLTHEVVYFGETASVLSANLGLILQARILKERESGELRGKIVKHFSSRAWMTLEELRVALGETSLEPIFSLLRTKVLHADLEQQLLSEPEEAIVSLERQYLDEAVSQRNQGKRVLAEPDLFVSVDRVPSGLQARKALERLGRLDEDSRTGRRIRKIVAAGSAEGMTPFQSVIPKYQKRGNRTPKIAKEVKTALESFLDSSEYSDSRNINNKSAYDAYIARACEAHPTLFPVSRKTFRQYVVRLDPVVHARRRKGRRGANAAKMPSSPVTRIIKDTVPFAMATIDHYNVDIFVEIGRDEKDRPISTRCWLSAMVDLATKDVLGWYLSLEAPSRIACSMVIRDCIRRNKRVPAVITTDGGAEFKSHHFKAMLAAFGIDRRLRPAGNPRYGSEVERLFKAFKEERLNGLPGNIQGVAHDRSVSRSHSPSRNAALTPENLLAELDTWILWRRTKHIGAAVETPEEKYSRKAGRYDFVGKEVDLCAETYILTAVETRSYKLSLRGGIHAGGGLHYWHEKLGELGHGEKIEVRLEHEDPYRIYALVKDEWITCTSTDYVVFDKKSSAMQRREAMLFFAPNECKERRKKANAQKLLAAQGALEALPGAGKNKRDVRPKQLARAEPKNPFDALDDSPLDDLEIVEWEGVE